MCEKYTKRANFLVRTQMEESGSDFLPTKTIRSTVTEENKDVILQQIILGGDGGAMVLDIFEHKY